MSRKVAEVSGELSGGHDNGTISLNNRTDVELAKLAKQLKKKGGTYRGIGKKLGISKSRAWRIINKDVDRTSISEENLDDSPMEIEEVPSLPFEPVEFLSDNELKKTSRRLKMELQVKRMRARSRWLDYIGKNPQNYQSNQQGFNGEQKEERMTSYERRNQAFQERLAIATIYSGAKQNTAQQLGIKDILAIMSAASQQQKDPYQAVLTYMNQLDQMKANAISQNKASESAIYEKASREADKKAKEGLIVRGIQEVIGPLKDLAKGAVGNAMKGGSQPPPPPTTETLTISPEEAHLPLENPKQPVFGNGGPSTVKEKKRKKKVIPPPIKTVSNLSEP